MRVVYAAFLLGLLTGACGHVAPRPPVSEPPAASPPPATTPQPASATAPPNVTAPEPKPAPAATPPNAPPAAPRAAGRPAAQPVTKTPPPIARAPTSAAPAAVATSAPLDLKALTEQLRATKAIGVFTKISLKNKVDDLLDQFRDYYQGKGQRTMAELRRSYDLLMMKVLSLLQDADQKLAFAIVSSREAIWGLLADPQKFATLQV